MKMFQLFKHCVMVPAIIGVLGVAPAWGAITYVDAIPNTDGNDGNTTVNGALVDFTGGSGNATTSHSSTDGLWHYREIVGDVNGDNAWQAFNATEDTSPLATTLTLAPGIYNLYGLFWSGTGNSFIVEFRVGDSGPYMFFDATNSTSTLTASDGSDFANTTKVRSTNFSNLRIADLGEFAITSPVTIYINGPETTSTSDPRTLYDGLGYEFVAEIPEPASLGLLLSGVLLLLPACRR